MNLSFYIATWSVLNDFDFAHVCIQFFSGNDVILKLDGSVQQKSWMHILKTWLR